MVVPAPLVRADNEAARPLGDVPPHGTDVAEQNPGPLGQG